MENTVAKLSQGGMPISLVDLLIQLVIATVLGLVIVFVYRWTHRGLHYERSFLVTLVMMPSIVGVVMMLIGSNLALSLGMVGALSSHHRCRELKTPHLKSRSRLRLGFLFDYREGYVSCINLVALG